MYDLNRLLRPKSADETRLSVEATRRIGPVFADRPGLGEERQPGVLWVPAKAFYELNRDVRFRLATDAAYLLRTRLRFEHHLERFRVALDATAMDVSTVSLCNCLERGADASAWFALNWLNPHQHIRMAIAFALGGDAVETVFREAIVVRGSSLLLRAFQHAATAVHADSTDTFTAPAQAIERGMPGGLTKVLELLRLRAGDRVAELFQLQLTFLRVSVQVEEERRRLQQSLYRILRDAWHRLPGLRREVVSCVPWFEFREQR